MSDTWPIDCANCGKQVITDGTPEDTCYWCGKSPYRKGVIMVQKMTNWAKHKFIEEHRAEILEDIGKLPEGEVRKKWSIGSNTYYQLSKGMIRVKARVEKRPATGSGLKRVVDNEVAELTEHERYLVLLGWQQAIREVLRAMGGGIKP